VSNHGSCITAAAAAVRLFLAEQQQSQQADVMAMASDPERTRLLAAAHRIWGGRHHSMDDEAKLALATHLIGEHCGGNKRHTLELPIAGEVVRAALGDRWVNSATRSSQGLPKFRTVLEEDPYFHVIAPVSRDQQPHIRLIVKKLAAAQGGRAAADGGAAAAATTSSATSVYQPAAAEQQQQQAEAMAMALDPERTRLLAAAHRIWGGRHHSMDDEAKLALATHFIGEHCDGNKGHALEMPIAGMIVRAALGDRWVNSATRSSQGLPKFRTVLEEDPYFHVIAPVSRDQQPRIRLIVKKLAAAQGGRAAAAAAAAAATTTAATAAGGTLGQRGSASVGPIAPLAAVTLPPPPPARRTTTATSTSVHQPVAAALVGAVIDAVWPPEAGPRECAQAALAHIIAYSALPGLTGAAGQDTVLHAQGPPTGRHGVCA
jgi:hypothetical protein